MIYSREVEEMCPVAQGVHHGAAPIPEEAKWVQAKEVKDISGLTHGVGWCAPQQGACKLTLNVKEGIIQEALVETIGCSGMTHSAAMASEILPGLTVMEALNTDLVCDAINTAMRELFLQIVYGRTQSAFSEEGLPVGAGLDVYDQVKKIQPICFENACWAYTVGAAIAIKKGCRRAADAAAAIGEGLQAFCIPGSVADHRKVGLGHGNLGKMLLEEETECFCFLAGHESFAAAEGAIGIAEKANKVRQKPLRVILNGLGKDAAQIISRINGFTFVETQYDYKAAKLNIVSEHAYSDGLRATVKCYGADDVQEGVAIMHHENVGVSITGNSTNPTRFQHPVAGTYKKECIEQGKKYFSVASGGGTGRTLHPDNMAAGPASYGMTDTMGRMHSDAQFAGSSSVPAHVEMMGLIGMGNNPMVGATVAVAVSVQQAADAGKF